jgi:hypothetical protein
MPFYLYQIKCNTCIQQRRESLLRVLKEFANNNVRSEIFQWHAREDDLLLGMGATGDDKHAVIIDLKPDTPENISLYEVEDVWGCSNEEWTPVALRLRPLFVDHKDKDAESVKKCFSMPSDEAVKENGTVVHEFLYCTHADGIDGRWRWGRNGVVNATLLWPEAFDYFVSSIQQRMRGSG